MPNKQKMSLLRAYIPQNRLKQFINTIKNEQLINKFILMKKALVLFSASAILLTSCVSNPDGKKAETAEATEISTSAEGATLNIDTAESSVKWLGKKVSGEHFGEINITSGNLVISEEGKLTGGTFVIDLNSIDVQDMEAGEYRDKLTGHLKSEDFFDVSNHPTATFEITEVKEGAATNDLLVSGNLTIRGITKNITFEAKASEVSAESFVADADFNIAREDWGVNYAGKADDLISKEINFKVKLIAKNQA